MTLCRLGVWSIKAELEDLCFQFLHQAQHKVLQRKLHESQDRGSIERMLTELHECLRARGELVMLSGCCVASGLWCHLSRVWPSLYDVCLCNLDCCDGQGVWLHSKTY